MDGNSFHRYVTCIFYSLAAIFPTTKNGASLSKNGYGWDPSIHNTIYDDNSAFKEIRNEPRKPLHYFFFVWKLVKDTNAKDGKQSLVSSKLIKGS